MGQNSLSLSLARAFSLFPLALSLASARCLWLCLSPSVSLFPVLPRSLPRSLLLSLSPPLSPALVLSHARGRALSLARARALSLHM